MVVSVVSRLASAPVLPPLHTSQRKGSIDTLETAPRARTADLGVAPKAALRAPRSGGSRLPSLSGIATAMLLLSRGADAAARWQTSPSVVTTSAVVTETIPASTFTTEFVTSTLSTIIPNGPEVPTVTTEITFTTTVTSTVPASTSLQTVQVVETLPPPTTVTDTVTTTATVTDSETTTTTATATVTATVTAQVGAAVANRPWGYGVGAVGVLVGAMLAL